jgi:hypothetical protein
MRFLQNRLPRWIGMLMVIGCATVVADEPKNTKPPPKNTKTEAKNTKTEAKNTKTEAKQPGHQPVSFWMEKKLQYTQDILRGLVSGDLDDVAEKAEQMRVLSRVEGWIRNRKPGYRAQLQAFELANAEILRNAQADNVDGATIAFQQLTISCVSCHKILRNVD